MKTNTLKHKLAAGVLVTAAGLNTTSHAEEFTKDQGITLGGTALIGGLAGGPPGLLGGLIFGALINETDKAQSQLETTEVDMQKALTQIAHLENDIQAMEQNLIAMEAESLRLQQSMLTRLEFQMMFRTGDDQISEIDKERVAILVNYLKRNPELEIRLDGHADKRGTEEYNNVLALYRANAIKEALVAGGIEESRIKAFSHGASQAKSINGDYEGYALDRRVNIEVFDPRNNKSLAILN